MYLCKILVVALAKKVQKIGFKFSSSITILIIAGLPEVWQPGGFY
jgi:hypothetical protein